MKKIHIILSTLLLFLGGVSVNAQTVYDFSNWDAITYSSTTTKNGLTVTASADKTVSVDANSKSIDGYTFTKRLKFGGGGSSNTRYASIEIPGTTS